MPRHKRADGFKPTEHRLMEYLRARPGQAISSRELMDALWGGPPPAYKPGYRYALVHTYMCWLRAKLPAGTISSRPYRGYTWHDPVVS
jgi:DNA-binding response OmpR family regulator